MTSARVTAGRFYNLLILHRKRSTSRRVEGGGEAGHRSYGTREERYSEGPQGRSRGHESGKTRGRRKTGSGGQRSGSISRPEVQRAIQQQSQAQHQRIAQGESASISPGRLSAPTRAGRHPVRPQPPQENVFAPSTSAQQAVRAHSHPSPF